MFQFQAWFRFLVLVLALVLPRISNSNETIISAQAPATEFFRPKF